VADERVARALPWGAAAAFAVPALWAARDYGLVFDAHFWFPFGDDVLHYVLGHGRWPLQPYNADLEAYGPLAATGAAVTNAVLHDWLGLVNPLLGHHVFIVLCGAALVGLTAWLARRFGGFRLGALAAALLAVSPRFFAEAVNNIVDAPATVVWTAAIACVVLALDTARVAPLFGAAVALGALGAIKLPNVPFVPLILLVWILVDAESRRGAGRLLVATRWWVLLALVLTAPLALWVFRPIAWTAPRVDFWTVYDRLFVPPPWMTRGIVSIFYRGQLLRGGPPSYHAAMFAVTTPVPQLLAAAVGAVVVWRRQRTAAWLLVVWLTVSVGRFAFLRLGNYDGVRHALDAFPALAVLEAFGVAGALDVLARRAPRYVAASTVAVLVVVLAPGATAIWRLHPYPMTYYNALVGGLAGAAHSFETEYSGAAYREAVAWAMDHLGAGDVLWITRASYDRRLVQVEASYLGLDPNRVQDGTALGFAERHARDGGRIFAVQNFRAPPEEKLPPGLAGAAVPLVYEVGRDGVPFLRIREVLPSDLQAVLATSMGR